MSKRQELIKNLTEMGFEYRQHKGGMYSKYHASEYVNREGETKYLYEYLGEDFWLEDTWRNVQTSVSIRKYGLMEGYEQE